MSASTLPNQEYSNLANLIREAISDSLKEAVFSTTKTATGKDHSSGPSGVAAAKSPSESEHGSECPFHLHFKSGTSRRDMDPMDFFPSTNLNLKATAHSTQMTGGSCTGASLSLPDKMAYWTRLGQSPNEIWSKHNATVVESIYGRDKSSLRPTVFPKDGALMGGSWVDLDLSASDKDSLRKGEEVELQLTIRTMPSMVNRDF